MVYTIDIVQDIVSNLAADTRPVLFQRDGGVYVASERGFGYVRHGVTDRDIFGYPDKEAKELFADSSAFLKGKRAFRKAELPHFEPLKFGPDHRCFTLDQMGEAAKTLGGLRDDGKVRVLSHDTSYRSHKYGQAADGLDVWLTSAYAVDREEFMRLLRKREDEIAEELGRMDDPRRVGIRGEGYNKVHLPDAFVMTPHMLVSVPCPGRLEEYRRGTPSWTSKTDLQPNMYGTFLHYELPVTWSENPFALHVTLNARPLTAVTARELDVAIDMESIEFQRGLVALKSAMPDIEAFVGELNERHNSVFAGDIAHTKKLRKMRV